MDRLEFYMPDIKKLNYELSAISRYAGLLYSKYTLLILLAIIYYPMRITPAYIFITAVLAPLLPRIVFATQQPARDKPDNFTLSYTAGRYHFTTENYKYEKLGSYFTLMLLLLWHIKVYYHSTYSLPLRLAPSLIIIIYILVRIIAGIIIKYKIKYNFMHLNI